MKPTTLLFFVNMMWVINEHAFTQLDDCCDANVVLDDHFGPLSDGSYYFDSQLEYENAWADYVVLQDMWSKM